MSQQQDYAEVKDGVFTFPQLPGQSQPENEPETEIARQDINQTLENENNISQEFISYTPESPPETNVPMLEPSRIDNNGYKKFFTIFNEWVKKKLNLKLKKTHFKGKSYKSAKYGFTMRLFDLLMKTSRNKMKDYYDSFQHMMLNYQKQWEYQIEKLSSLGVSAEKKIKQFEHWIDLIPYYIKSYDLFVNEEVELSIKIYYEIGDFKQAKALAGAIEKVTKYAIESEEKA